MRPKIVALCLAWAMAVCVGAHAQTGKTVTVIMLDGKTGEHVKPSNYLVRVDRLDDVHNEWLHVNDDGSAQVALPDGAKLLSMQATYDSSMETYVNCDGAKEKAKNDPHWYTVDDILKKGMVAANQCGKANRVVAPGVFVFYVRKRDWRDSPMR